MSRNVSHSLSICLTSGAVAWQEKGMGVTWWEEWECFIKDNKDMQEHQLTVSKDKVSLCDGASSGLKLAGRRK